MEENLTEQRIKPVSTLFEIAAARMVDSWLAAGRVEISRSDVDLAREFLDESGWRVAEVESGLRVVRRDGRVQQMSREAAVMAALRKLATRD